MGHDWDQPGEHGPVRTGGGGARGHTSNFERREGAPSGQRRDAQPAPSGFGDQAGGAAMEAGRYDLSATANRRFQAWTEAWAREAYRVLKPGGHLLCFASSRTYHRMAAGVEDAGFEIRDTLAWMYGSGFPKSLDVSKAIDKAAGAEREVLGYDLSKARPNRQYENGATLTAPATDDAARWEGWGTALKPAYEPIVLARKPLVGTVAQNVLEHGTGALNIGASRIEFASAADEAESKEKNRHGDFGTEQGGNNVYGDYSMLEARGNYDPVGRWPTNLLLDADAAVLLDEQTGDLPAGVAHRTQGGGNTFGGEAPKPPMEDLGYPDAGGASRFFKIFEHDDEEPSRFLYCPKTSTAERNAGLAGFEAVQVNITEGHGRGDINTSKGGDGLRENRPRQNVHPTVKPITLMRWLCRLVTPPGGVVLDPFVGSGTTGCAAVLEGFSFVGCEREAEYARIAEARIAWWEMQPADVDLPTLLQAEAKRRSHEDSGQLGIFG